jgi:hypothetical protein
VRASGSLPLHERVLGLHALTRRGLAENVDFCAARGARDWGFWKLLLSEAREKVYTKGARLIRERDPPDRLARTPPAPESPSKAGGRGDERGLCAVDPPRGPRSGVRRARE